MNKYVVVGLMSGTSLDGLDLACVNLTETSGKWTFEMIETRHFSYPSVLLKEVREVLGKNLIAKKQDLNLKYSKWVTSCVLEFKRDFDQEIDLIASHGQTIYHSPEKGLSIQLDDGQYMADQTSITVVNDFRTQDLKHGGQGAPLVPIGDLMLFNKYKYCLNLGGIANISAKHLNGIIAYDVSICNVGANFLVKHLFMPYDDKGIVGSKGSLLKDVFEKWNSMSYFKKSPPKSLDASFFDDMKKEVDFSLYKKQDLLHTLYHHIAFQINKSIDQPEESILITGGGALNNFLISILKDTYKLNIHLPESNIIEFKEALIFGFLGVLRVRNEKNVLCEVTGASKDHSSGKIYYPSK